MMKVGVLDTLVSLEIAGDHAGASVVLGVFEVGGAVVAVSELAGTVLDVFELASGVVAVFEADGIVLGSSLLVSYSAYSSPLAASWPWPLEASLLCSWSTAPSWDVFELEKGVVGVFEVNSDVTVF
jgi:hypothetical protein